MSVRRLHREQPENFAFTPGNLAWAEQEMTKYPEGRQASAVISLLWRAQEQEGWVTRPMIHEIARMLGMDPIRVLEVATFYFMFHLQPVGSVAHVQVCGTTSCMLCGAEDLIGVCREKIAPEPYEISADGKFSWEEVECLGACSNAPMAQIGKDYYEDLTAESFAALLDAMARGEVPQPGSQAGRYASEPVTGRTALAGDMVHDLNASVDLALIKGDTLARITGEPAAGRNAAGRGAMRPHDAATRTGEPAGDVTPEAAPSTTPDPRENAEDPAPLSSDRTEIASASEKTEAAERQSVKASEKERNGSGLPPQNGSEKAPAATTDGAPERMAKPRGGKADDLKDIVGIGPKFEELLNGLGIWHFDQIAAWGPEEIAWIEGQLEGFKGRVERDDWVGQARELATGTGPGAGGSER